MYYFKNEQAVYFNHIPRAGGRQIKAILRLNGYKTNYQGNELIYGRELYHLDKHRQRKYYKDNVNIIDVDFAVVRHPIERFRSAFYFIELLHNDYQTKLEDYNYFYYFMEEQFINLKKGEAPYETKILCDGLKNIYNNWFFPQTEFIKPNTKIWKFENGFNDNLIEWLKFIGIRIELNTLPSYSQGEYDKAKPNLSNKVQENILKYYEDDLKLWKSL